MSRVLPNSGSRRLIQHVLLVFTFISGFVLSTPAVFSADDRSQALQLLGQQIFLDRSLSQDGKESCASCHKPDNAFSDGRMVSIGIHKHAGTRNTPSLLSLSGTSFFWDGRSELLEKTVLQPFTNPVEMGLKNSDILLQRLQHSVCYRIAFQHAFPEAPGTPTLPETGDALAAYVRSLNHDGNAYDYYLNGDASTLSDQAQRGLALFAGSAHCAECHHTEGNPAPFTDSAFHSTLINPRLARQLPAAAVQLAQTNPGSDALNALIESDAVTSELGRYVVTRDPRDIGAFRTPSLRNVALTAPYMHDGSAKTLRDAVDREIYYRSLQSGQPNTLTEQDRQDLVAFLEALTDQPRHSAMEDRLDGLLMP